VSKGFQCFFWLCSILKLFSSLCSYLLFHTFFNLGQVASLALCHVRVYGSSCRFFPLKKKSKNPPINEKMMNLEFWIGSNTAIVSASPCTIHGSTTNTIFIPSPRTIVHISTTQYLSPVHVLYSRISNTIIIPSPCTTAHRSTTQY
jgi:hypothetical protein